eukprot:s3241_g9.t1
MALFLSQTLEIDEPEPLRLRFFSFFPVPLFACEGVGPEWFKLCSAHKHWHKMPTGPESLIPRRGGWMCYWNTQGKHDFRKEKPILLKRKSQAKCLQRLAYQEKKSQTLSP